MAESPRRLAGPGRIWLEVGKVAALLVTEAGAGRRIDVAVQLAGRLVQILTSLGIAPKASQTDPAAVRSLYGLSDREMQVLWRLSRGRTNADIARELCVSEDTVKTHARRLYQKLKARDRAHAAAIALRTGLIT